MSNRSTATLFKKGIFAATLVAATVTFDYRSSLAQEVVEVTEVIIVDVEPIAEDRSWQGELPYVVASGDAMPSGYCHMKIPEVEDRTVGMGEVRMKRDPGASDFIDFHGPCNTDPIQIALERTEELDDFEEMS
jgi:hypothetical protein